MSGWRRAAMPAGSTQATQYMTVFSCCCLLGLARLSLVQSSVHYQGPLCLLDWPVPVKKLTGLKSHRTRFQNHFWWSPPIGSLGLLIHTQHTCSRTLYQQLCFASHNVPVCILHYVLGSFGTPFCVSLYESDAWVLF